MLSGKMTQDGLNILLSGDLDGTKEKCHQISRNRFKGLEGRFETEGLKIYQNLIKLKIKLVSTNLSTLSYFGR